MTFSESSGKTPSRVPFVGRNYHKNGIRGHLSKIAASCRNSDKNTDTWRSRAAIRDEITL
jgi:hypothetical protein